MDMFTDKLSQKLTAEEIIRANTEADFRELNKLRSQAAEYTECLTKMRTLIEEGAGRFSALQEGAHEDGQAWRREVECLRQDAEVLKRETEDLRQAVADMKQHLDQLQEHFNTVDKAVAWQLESMQKELWDRLDEMRDKLEAKSGTQLTESVGGLEETVHKECVKVYRNVQAAVNEELGKHRVTTGEVKADVLAVRGRLGAVLIISLLAALFSVMSIVLQILVHMNLLPF